VVRELVGAGPASECLSVMPRKPLLLDASVTAERGTGPDGSELYFVKLQTAAFELNVSVMPRDIPQFDRVRTARWIDGAVRIGEAAGAPVFWCVNDEDDAAISVLVGNDDQTWDIAVTLPAGTVDQIRRELAACGDAGSGA
jgi:hypothetical protein